MKRRVFLGTASAGLVSAIAAGPAVAASPGSGPLPAGLGAGRSCAAPVVPEAVPSSELIRFPEAAYATEPDAPGVLNVKTLFGAVGDGVTDDTDAIIAAIDAVEGGIADSIPEERPFHIGPLTTQKVIYFPEGTYLVSRTLVYSFPYFTTRPTTTIEGHTSLRLRGESQTGTVIRLADNAPGFGEGEQRPVLAWGKAYENDNPYNNTAGSNFLENLTVDTGSGNSGAIGVILSGSNCNALRNVTIRSGDGAGVAGLDLFVAGTQWYGYNVDIHGFDVGVRFADTGAACCGFERFSLYDQNVHAVEVTFGSLSLFNLRTNGSVPAVVVDGEGAMATITASDLRTDAAGLAAITLGRGALAVRDVAVSGFASGIERDGAVVEPASIGHYVSEGPFTALPTEPATALGLRPPAPGGFTCPPGRAGALGYPPGRPYEHSWGDPSTWVSVADFGTVADAIADDTAAIAAAFASGAATIWFPPGQYRVTDTIEIPGSVNRINFMYCRINVDEVLVQPAGTSVEDEYSVFRITGSYDDEPLLLEDLYTRPMPSVPGAYRMFEHASDRTLLMQDMHLHQAAAYRNTAPGGVVHFEAVASRTSGVGEGNPAIVLDGGKVAWARHINPEDGFPDILVRGGSQLWVLSMKKQNKGTMLHVEGNSVVEILGAIVFGGRTEDGIPLIRCIDSTVSVSLAHRTAPGILRGYTPLVHETRDGVDGYVHDSELPARNVPPLSDAERFLPLYVARHTAAQPI
ncbi:hypothetical protein IM660_03795 [Ruania alkalisoli]|uniref:Rhamnogalacturonase A/B/Epimerase-like pectate lyase domain-containing protein n=1 Tax=Ruania alkalisoli TaxID=2779775 RepID=A0A7M1SXH1_9MICO|nr:glycosyl hydrolase family 28-related protein [Ruania alkalisoli]QOR71432.1 hypothetical protein IM660_03795 [Ruania alkalisoli]